MSNYRCCVPGCGNVYSHVSPEITFHPFPTSGGFYVQWIEKIGPNVQVTRNSRVCSSHFKEEDFESGSGRRVLASSAVPSIFAWKAKVNEEDTMESKIKKAKYSYVENLGEIGESSSAINLMHLPVDPLEHIISFLSLNEVVALSSVCVDLMIRVQPLVKKWDLRNNYGLDVKSFLNYALSTTCTTINMNYCYWLKPKDILEMISKTKPSDVSKKTSKTNLVHLHVIECELDDECIAAIGQLELLSLSFTYTKAWKRYLDHRLSKTILCFKTIGSLEIFHKRSVNVNCTSIFREITNTVFQHCSELEHLTISNSKLTYRHQCHRESRLATGSTPLLKLKSLVVDDFKDCYASEFDIRSFKELLFRNKVIPFEHVDFGIWNRTIFESGLIVHRQIVPYKSTFRIWLDRHREFDRTFDDWLNSEQVQSVINRPNYSKLVLEGFRANGLYEMVQKLVSNSSQTIKEIEMEFNETDHMLDSLIHLALNCPRIAVVDLSEHHFPLVGECLRYEEKLHEVLEALAGLKNLEKLVLNVRMFSCRNAEGLPSLPAPPLWKVTSACEKLTDVRIISGAMLDSSRLMTSTVLLDIGHCKNLKTLYLESIHTVGFDLSRITLECTKLEHLFLRDVTGLLYNSLAQSLLYANKMKTLSVAKIYRSSDYFLSQIHLNESFINNLRRCENLERIYLDRVSLATKDAQYFSTSLLQLKHLVAVIIDEQSGRLKTKELRDYFRRFAREKPASFFYSLLEDSHSNVPEAHLDLIYY